MKPPTLHISPEVLVKLFKDKMNGAARWKKLAAHPLFNSMPNTPSTSTKELPPDPSLSPSLGERLRDVFPAGFESNSKSIRRDHFTFTPYHLHDILTRNSGGNGHVEKTIVKSAWYGKQTKSAARHEYIILQVEDLAIPGLQNCIALDRNQSDISSPTGGVATVSAISSGIKAVDSFRVSYDGNLDRFLKDCQLTPHIELEQIRFPNDKPLLLLDLVTLVLHISDEHPQYKALDTNCYWYTGLIWECMRGMCPTADRTVCVPKKRGRIGFVRCVPNPVQVRNVLRETSSASKPPNLEVPQSQNESTSDLWETESMSAIYAEVSAAGPAVETDEMECLTCRNCAGR